MAHKNLSYESKEPAFLQRLRAQTAGSFHQQPLNRPRKQRNPDDDDDDEPVYVLEDNTTLSGKEFEALKTESENKTPEDGKGDDSAEPSKQEDGTAETTDESKDKRSVLDAGVKAQKRKIVKVIGGDGSDNEETGKSGVGKSTGSAEATVGDKPLEPQRKKRPKSKQKVKLSFDDD